MSAHVFEGLKVADFSWVAVGPLITRYLADHGATVIKIESTGRVDVNRVSPPFKDDIPGFNRGGWPLEWMRNKYSLTLNLRHPDGLALARKLVAWADVVIENFTPGVTQRLGLDYEQIKKIKPDIIMLSASMQGQTGPHAAHPGYGVQMTGLAGFLHLTGWPDRSPVELYGAYSDFIVPRFGAVALISALDYRRRTGKGQYIDLSQLECCLHFLSPLILDYEANGNEWSRMGNFCSYAAPHGAYRCRSNDQWCAIAVFTDEEWDGLCRVIDAPALKEPNFSTLLKRQANAEELDNVIEAWTSLHSPREVMSLLQGAGVPAGMVERGEDLHCDPQLKHRRYFQFREHAEIGSCSHSRLPFVLSKTPGEVRMSAPLLGEHNDYVCTEILGLSDEKFVQMLQEGVFE